MCTLWWQAPIIFVSHSYVPSNVIGVYAYDMHFMYRYDIIFIAYFNCSLSNPFTGPLQIIVSNILVDIFSS